MLAKVYFSDLKSLFIQCMACLGFVHQTRKQKKLLAPQKNLLVLGDWIGLFFWDLYSHQILGDFHNFFITQKKAIFKMELFDETSLSIKLYIHTFIYKYITQGNKKARAGHYPNSLLTFNVIEYFP